MPLEPSTRTCPDGKPAVIFRDYGVRSRIENRVLRTLAVSFCYMVFAVLLSNSTKSWPVEGTLRFGGFRGETDPDVLREDIGVPDQHICRATRPT